MIRIGMTVAMVFGALAVVGDPVVTTIEETSQGWVLKRDGVPYTVKGAGGPGDIEILAKMGGNSIRTWGEGEIESRDAQGRNLLDRAHELGLSVCVGYWVEHPRHGVSYDDEAFVQDQLEKARAFVRKYKDHPAVLMWGVGNEVALGGSADDARIYREVNRVAKVFKEEDPNHPTMTAVPGVWPNHAGLFAQYCPDVDILGVNAYSGLPAVPQELQRQGYFGPYVVTEYGPIGHWESAKTSWGAEVEQSSAGKARTYTEFHHQAITNQPDRSVGGYIFLWGHKQERTESWFSMFMPTGEKTATVDAMARIWSGPEFEFDNEAPLIDAIESTLSLHRVAPGSEHRSVAVGLDPDGDKLDYEWYVRAESTDKRQGGDEEAVPPMIDGTIKSQSGASAVVRAPREPGAYRLFVVVRDGRGGAGTVNVPFYVEK